MLKIESEREDDGRWIAEVMELPGVIVYGQTRDDAIQMRIKLGAGIGNGQFGAPEWRILAAIEMFNHNHRD